MSAAVAFAGLAAVAFTGLVVAAVAAGLGPGAITVGLLATALQLSFTVLASQRGRGVRTGKRAWMERAFGH
ncbi:hypothetical protein [Nonomuraea sp. NPDC050540]|uniref:hypothetical protein n=1 Tax=Nonomuraea sp. NPDC050540 TaxID=3364367 RepID=UPI003797C84D